MPEEKPRYPLIDAYALVGDGRSAALISRAGSVDWLCWPTFDGPSVFAAVLDADRGGRFAVAPVRPARIERRYRPGSALLETTFTTDTGRLEVVDLMPMPGAVSGWGMDPQRELLRRVRCTAGRVRVGVECAPRPGYGRQRPRPERRGRGRLVWDFGDVLVLRSGLALGVEGPDARGEVLLHAGQTAFLSLGFTRGEPAVLPLLGRAAEERLDATEAWWRSWAAQCRYDGPYRDAVLRSAVTLKLLTFAATGAVVAAPTTSLPERIGGERNWDYRYSWLRDTSLAQHALYDLGYTEEAAAFHEWVLHATYLSRPSPGVFYTIHGRAARVERRLSHLEGYRGSQPVRVGNAAARQVQLDTYGFVVDAVYRFVQYGGALRPGTLRLLVDLGEAVCRRWREPDEGIWEIRGGRRQHTYSKVMCWVALDRLVRLASHGRYGARIPAARFAEVRAAVRRVVERHGYDPGLESYVSVLGGDRVDASLLLMALYGYHDAAAPRMASTYRCIRRRLGSSGLLYRYDVAKLDDPMGGCEGAFGISTFWGIIYEALAGRDREAADHFDEVLSHANDVGLFAEEVDPETGHALGNFPQALTHIGLIHAALALHRQARADTDVSRGQPQESYV